MTDLKQILWGGLWAITFFSGLWLLSQFANDLNLSGLPYLLAIIVILFGSGGLVLFARNSIEQL